MAIQHANDHEMMVLDPEREWGVQQCCHGCVHVTLDRITLTFTEAELFALHDLLHKACEGLLETATRRASGARPN
jgi:xanthine/CO dehydrogenase XdhC/CoxF family maturation factor